MSYFYQRRTHKPLCTVEKLWVLNDAFEKHFHRSSIEGRTVWGRPRTDSIVRFVLCFFLFILVAAAVLSSVVYMPLWLAIPLSVSITLAFSFSIWFVIKTIPLRSRARWLSNRKHDADEFETGIDKMIIELFAHMYGVPVENIHLDDTRESLRKLHRFYSPPLECELKYGLELVYETQYSSAALERAVASTVDQKPRTVREFSRLIEKSLRES
jgi:uncharacterized protein (DUF983 family)